MQTNYFLSEHISVIMEKIRNAKPGVFNKEGKIITAEWTKVIIPENTVDIFELYTQLLLDFWVSGLTGWTPGTTTSIAGIYIVERTCYVHRYTDS